MSLDFGRRAGFFKPTALCTSWRVTLATYQYGSYSYSILQLQFESSLRLEAFSVLCLFVFTSLSLSPMIGPGT